MSFSGRIGGHPLQHRKVVILNFSTNSRNGIVFGLPQRVSWHLMSKEPQSFPGSHNMIQTNFLERSTDNVFKS